MRSGDYVVKEHPDQRSEMAAFSNMHTARVMSALTEFVTAYETDQHPDPLVWLDAMTCDQEREWLAEWIDVYVKSTPHRPPVTPEAIAFIKRLVASFEGDGLLRKRL